MIKILMINTENYPISIKLQEQKSHLKGGYLNKNRMVVSKQLVAS